MQTLLGMHALKLWSSHDSWDECVCLCVYVCACCLATLDCTQPTGRDIFYTSMLIPVFYWVSYSIYVLLTHSQHLDQSVSCF